MERKKDKKSVETKTKKKVSKSKVKEQSKKKTMTKSKTKGSSKKKTELKSKRIVKMQPQNDVNMQSDVENLVLSIIFVLLIIIASIASTYAFFQFTRTGSNNLMEPSFINFDFVDNNQNLIIGNATPIDLSDIDNDYEVSFDIVAHTNISKGIEYKIYAVYGDDEPNKTRLLDDVISIQFISPEDSDGFTTTVNNYETGKSPEFVSGKALLSTGLVKNTANLTTKTYKVRMWIDSNKIIISSTTKRLSNEEGNPSLADITEGRISVDRYIRNDGNLISATLYPAKSEEKDKFVYTTNEYKNSYYSIKIVVEANDLVDNGN